MKGVTLMNISDTTVGVVGLGKMGNPMVRHLARNGFNVIGYDVREEAINAITGDGIEGTDSLTWLAANSDVIIIIVGFDNEVKSICLDEEVGIFHTMKEDSVLIICSTVEPETMTWLKDHAPSTIHLLDAPLCRGEIAAEKGELLALVGGNEKAYSKSFPVLQTFCSDIEYLGDLGTGQVGKALNNFLLWSCISANYEALKLGDEYGVDQEKLRKALLKSSGENWALHTWNRPRTMPWAEKDMMIVLKMADEKVTPMPLAGFIKENIKLVKKEKNLSAPKSTK